MKKLILLFLIMVVGISAQRINQHDVISSVNSTATAIDSAAVFTGVAEEIIYESAITILIRSDQSGTGEVQYSKDATNWDLKIPFTYTALDSTTKYIFGSHSRWFRVVYTNGTTDQTYFRMQTIYHKEPVLSYTDGKLDVNASASSTTPIATYTSSNLFGGAYAQTVTTETDSIAFTGTTKFVNFSIWSDNDTLEVSLDGTFTKSDRVLPYMNYSLSNIDPVTFPRAYVKRQGTTGTPIYDYTWMGR